MNRIISSNNIKERLKIELEGLGYTLSGTAANHIVKIKPRFVTKNFKYYLLWVIIFVIFVNAELNFLELILFLLVMTTLLVMAVLSNFYYLFWYIELNHDGINIIDKLRHSIIIKRNEIVEFYVDKSNKGRFCVKVKLTDNDTYKLFIEEKRVFKKERFNRLVSLLTQMYTLPPVVPESSGGWSGTPP